MIKKSLHPEIKKILKALLKIKAQDRPDIDQVLKFDAF